MTVVVDAAALLPKENARKLRNQALVAAGASGAGTVVLGVVARQLYRTGHPVWGTLFVLWAIGAASGTALVAMEANELHDLYTSG